MWKHGSAASVTHAPQWTLDDALLVWVARDVYRVKAFGYGVVLLLLGADWLVLTHALGIVWGTVMVVVHAGLLSGAWRLLRWCVGRLVWGCGRLLRRALPGSH